MPHKTSLRSISLTPNTEDIDVRLESQAFDWGEHTAQAREDAVLDDDSQRTRIFRSMFKGSRVGSRAACMPLQICI